MEHAALAVALSAALAGTSLDAVLGRLNDRSNPAGQIEAAAELSRRTAGLDYADQRRVESALEAAASDPFSDGGVRAKSLDALGRTAAASSDDAVRYRALTALLEHAGATSPHDSRTQTRVYALRGLAQAMPGLPDDGRMRRAVLATALDAMRDASRPMERTQGVILLDAALHAGCGATLLSDSTLSARLDVEVLAPAESGGALGLYDGSDMTEYRFYLMRSLAMLGNLVHVQGGLPWRARNALRALAERDPDPRLREMGRLYSRPRR